MINGREFLYNSREGGEGAGLCFWPVDNSVSDDRNILELRHNIVRAIKEDKAGYLDDPIPVPWLNVLNRLSMIGEDEPLLPVFSDNDDKDAVSVINVMRECNAFDDIDDNDIESQKRRTVAFLQFCDQLGSFVYFDDGHCILDPQWLVNTMTYLFRDIRLHRSRRDHRTIEVDGGRPWRKLFFFDGILEEPLLRRLWLGEDDDSFEYLVDLMIQIGLFARLPSVGSGGDGSMNRYLVPGALTSTSRNMSSIVPFVGSEEDRLMEVQARIEGRLIEDHIGRKYEKMDITFKEQFVPPQYFERLTTRLVSTWYSETSDLLPRLRPNISLLHMGNEKLPFALIIDEQSRRIKVIYDQPQIVHHVKRAANEINIDFYSELYQEERNRETIEETHKVSNVLAPSFV